MRAAANNKSSCLLPKICLAEAKGRAKFPAAVTQERKQERSKIKRSYLRDSIESVAASARLDVSAELFVAGADSTGLVHFEVVGAVESQDGVAEIFIVKIGECLEDFCAFHVRPDSTA